MAVPTGRLVGNGNMSVADWLGVGDMSMTISAGAMVSACETVGIDGCAEAAARARNDRNLVSGGTVSPRAEAMILTVNANRLPDILTSVSSVWINRMSIDGDAVAIASMVDLTICGSVSVAVMDLLMAVMNLLMAMMLVHGSRVNVCRVGVGISLLWGHIVNLSLLLDNLELDSGLYNLHVVHRLVSVRRNVVHRLGMGMLHRLGIGMLHRLGLLLVAVSLLLGSAMMVICLFFHSHRPSVGQVHVEQVDEAGGRNSYSFERSDQIEVHLNQRPKGRLHRWSKIGRSWCGTQMRKRLGYENEKSSPAWQP